MQESGTTSSAAHRTAVNTGCLQPNCDAPAGHTGRCFYHGLQRANLTRWVLYGGDQKSEHERGMLTVQQATDLRDRAWTARDLVSITLDRIDHPYPWWELEWWGHYVRLRDTIRAARQALLGAS